MVNNKRLKHWAILPIFGDVIKVAKEGKVFERKKLLQPFLGNPEGTKLTSTIISFTSHALTVYSIGQ